MYMYIPLQVSEAVGVWGGHSRAIVRIKSNIGVIIDRCAGVQKAVCLRGESSGENGESRRGDAT